MKPGDKITLSGALYSLSRVHWLHRTEMSPGPGEKVGIWWGTDGARYGGQCKPATDKNKQS